jgi:hypothetical protein
MPKHSAKTEQFPVVGRHMGDGYVPPNIVDPARPRVRNSRYENLLAALMGALYANAFLIGVVLFLTTWVLIALGPDRLPGFIIIMFCIWAWMKRGSRRK